MSAAKLLQFAIVEGLRAKAGAIDAKAAEFAQLSQRQFGFDVSLRNLRVLCVSAVNICLLSAHARWIQLDRDFRAIDDLEAFVHSFQDPFDLRRREQ